MEFEKYDINLDYHHIESYKKKYGICKIITIGFIAGAILDFIIPCTFGLIAKFLKKYGSTIYELRFEKPKSKILNKIINFFL